MTEIIFDPDSHTYTLGGAKLPSVTQILGQFRRVKLGDLRYVVDVFNGRIFPAEMFDDPADYGTAIHEGCRLLLTGQGIDYAALADELVYPLQQFEIFLREYRIEPIAVEQKMYSARYRYAGTPDLACRMLGQKTKWVLDIKTGSVLGMAGPQTSAYEKMLIEHNLLSGRHNRRGVLLPPKKGEKRGGWRIKPLTGKHDWKFFEARLKTHYLLTEGKLS